MTHSEKLDTFSVLPEAEYEAAKALYQAGKSLGCKISSLTRALKNQPKGYRIIFGNRDTGSVLFWMQITDGALYVKANLFHIGGYEDKISACSAKIKNAVTATKECGRCGLCAPRPPYRVDGKLYNPCCFHGHYFTHIGGNDWQALCELIALEHERQNEDENAAPDIPSGARDPMKPYHGFHR